LSPPLIIRRIKVNEITMQKSPAIHSNFQINMHIRIARFIKAIRHYIKQANSLQVVAQTILLLRIRDYYM